MGPKMEAEALIRASGRRNSESASAALPPSLGNFFWGRRRCMDLFLRERLGC